MIDIQDELYTLLSTTLKAYDSSVETASVFTNSPSSYPFVGIMEADNSIYTNGITDCCKENFANIPFEIDVRTTGDDRKSKAYKLLEVANDKLLSIGYTRVSMTPMQDQNETLFRIVARYEAVVGKDHTIYRR